MVISHGGLYVKPMIWTPLIFGVFPKIWGFPGITQKDIDGLSWNILFKWMLRDGPGMALRHWKLALAEAQAHAQGASRGEFRWENRWKNYSGYGKLSYGKIYGKYMGKYMEKLSYGSILLVMVPFLSIQ